MKSFWFLWLTWAFQGAAGIAMVTLSTAYGLSKGLAMESAVAILTPSISRMEEAGSLWVSSPILSEGTSQ